MDVPSRQRQLTPLPGSSKRLKRTRDCSAERRAFFMCQSDQNVARFRRKYIGTTKTPCVFAKNALGQAKRRAFSQKTRRDKQNAARFRRNCVGTTKTSRVFVKNALGQAKCRRVELPQRKSDHHPKKFSPPNAILLKPRTGGTSPTQRQPPQQPPHRHQGLTAPPLQGCIIPPLQGCGTPPL